MIVYFDQNKWIEIARIVNGKDKSFRAKETLNEIDAAADCGYIFPLSAIHIMEFARIKNSSRRAKLGKVMWRYSKGHTTAPLKEILCREIEIALSVMGYNVNPRELNYIGKGIPHAFGEELDDMLSRHFSEEIDEAMLCGYEDIPPIFGVHDKYKNNFTKHLGSLNERKHELEKSKWENWLYAISMIDIMEPLYEVMNANKIPTSDFEAWGEEGLKKFMDSIPTRKLDIHLHRQVLRNSSYRPKINDLEDWSGLGTAVCYSDVVVCERHFADLVKRDSYKTHARVESNLCNLFSEISN